MKTISLVMLGLALVTVPSMAGEPAVKDKDVRMDVDFKSAPLYEVQNALRTATGTNFVIDPAAYKQEDGEAREIKVDMQLKNVKVETVLNLLAKLYGLSFTTVDDVVVITRPERVAEEPMTVVFDVFDLSVLRHRPSYFSNVRNFGAYQNGYGYRFSSSYYSPEQEYYERWLDEQRPMIEPLELVKLVMATVPANWSEGAGTSIAYANGLLIVRQPAEVQLEIAKLLYRLRMRH